MDLDTGELILRGSLNYEVTTSYQLVILATDSSTPLSRLSSYSTVVINVTDVNEHQPNFPVFWYIEKVLENSKPGTYVFGAHARDDDKGPYGVVQYSLEGADNLFQIDSDSGDVVTLVTFNYMYEKTFQFKVKATDKGGKFQTITVYVNVAPQPSLGPQFEEKQYSFIAAGSAKKGNVIGWVRAVDYNVNSSGIVLYSLREPSEYFNINSSTGAIFLLKDLLPVDSSRSKRASDSSTLNGDVILVVVASSGFPNPRISEIQVVVSIDRTCAGCSIEPQTTPFNSLDGNNSLLSGTPLALVIAFVIIVAIFIVVFAVIFARHRAQKSASHTSSRYGDSNESIPDLPAPVMYNIGLQSVSNHVAFDSVHGNTTTASEPSHSSGRGSADDNEDVDDELRMINATPRLYTQPLTTLPDSALPCDDDLASENMSIMDNVHNHQEYFARLGIHSTGGATGNQRRAQPTVGAAISVESMHQFSEEGGGEDCGTGGPSNVEADDEFEGSVVESGNGAGEVMGVGSCTNMSGSLASIVNSEEEFGGSYGWDYLLNWTPQYHPLAQVFVEFARLKDDVVKPKIAPTQIVPQIPIARINAQNQDRTALPPPIITDAPPKAYPAAKTSPQNAIEMLNQSNPASNRTSMLTCVSLPKSPISYESTCTSPMMSPSFSPTLSPLANHSPSYSPIVSARGLESCSSGHTTPQQHLQQQWPTSDSSSRQIVQPLNVMSSSQSYTPYVQQATNMNQLMKQQSVVPVPYQTSRLAAGQRAVNSNGGNVPETEKYVHGSNNNNNNRPFDHMSNHNGSDRMSNGVSKSGRNTANGKMKNDRSPNGYNQDHHNRNHNAYDKNRELPSHNARRYDSSRSQPHGPTRHQRLDGPDVMYMESANDIEI